MQWPCSSPRSSGRAENGCRHRAATAAALLGRFVKSCRKTPAGQAVAFMGRIDEGKAVFAEGGGEHGVAAGAGQGAVAARIFREKAG